MSLIAELNSINAIFDRLNIDAHVRPQDVTASDTGNFVRFRVQTNGKYGPITQLTDELGDALSDVRGTLVDVQWVRPLALQVPHPAPVALAWDLAPLDQLTPGQFSPGRDYSNGHPRPVIMDLSHSSTPHLLVGTTTGGGKSMLLAGMVLSLCHATSPQDVQIYLIDPKPSQDPDLRILAGLPQVAALIHDPADAVALLQRMVEELTQREQPNSKPGGPRLLLVIDELADLTDTAGPAVEAALTRLLQKGRGYGMHVWAATQKPLAAVIGSRVKGNFPAILAGRVANADDSRTLASGHDIQAHKLPGNGSFILIAAGQTTRLQAHYLPDKTTCLEVERIAELFEAAAANHCLPAAQSQAAAANEEIARQAQTVLAHHPLAALLKPDGSEAYGAQTKVIKVLFGPTATNGGSYRTTAQTVLAHLAQQRSQPPAHAEG